MADYDVNTDMSGISCPKGGSCRGQIQDEPRGKAVACGRCGKFFGYVRGTTTEAKPETKPQPKRRR